MIVAKLVRHCQRGVLVGDCSFVRLFVSARQTHVANLCQFCVLAWSDGGKINIKMCLSPCRRFDLHTTKEN